MADGAGYYAWARSAVFDRDLHLANEYAAAPWEAEPAAGAHVEGPINKYTVGLSLLELVPIAIAALLIEPFWPDSTLRGYGGAYQLTLALTFLAAGIGAPTLIMRAIERDRGRRTAALAAWTLLGATGLIEFGSRLISYTHLMDVTLLLTLWWLAHQPDAGTRRHAVMGVLGGLAIVMRPTNVLLLPWIVAWAAYRGQRLTRRGAAATAAACAIPLLAQLLAQRLHRGDWLAEPYPGERFEWLAPRLAETLWSFEAGWLTWHPIYVVLLGGLLVSWRGFREPGPARVVWWSAAAAVVALIWINAAWWAWHGGAMQFGNRLFLAVTPMLIVMTAYGTRMVGHRLTPIVLALLIAWNGYAFAGVSVARLRGNWDPSLRDVLGWESHVIGAVHGRWSKERDRISAPSDAVPSSAR
jgi:hypothetical protein